MSMRFGFKQEFFKDEEVLPLVGPDLLVQRQDEYQSSIKSGNQAVSDAARFKLVWTQVHCTDLERVKEGYNAACAKIDELKDSELKEYKEWAYLLAVAIHRLGGSTIHSRRLLKQFLQDKSLEDHKEAALMLAVACFRLQEYGEAKRLLKQVLQAHPDWHQADHLKSRVDGKIMRRKGIWGGVGFGAAALGVGLAVLFKSRK